MKSNWGNFISCKWVKVDYEIHVLVAGIGSHVEVIGYEIQNLLLVGDSTYYLQNKIMLEK